MNNHNYRAGFIAIVGRPNVGKSTLSNSLIGEKLSIVSRKSQTTRHRIKGVLTQENRQFVFIDTPGFQLKYLSTLNRMMNRVVSQELLDVDIILHVIEAGKWIEDDSKLLEIIPDSKIVILVLNKIDLIKDKNSLLPFISNLMKIYNYKAFVPISALRNNQIDYLLNEISSYLPIRNKIFNDDYLTDRSSSFFVSEILREKIFRLTGNEIPYECTTLVEKWEEKNNSCYLSICVFVRSNTHKAILLGHKGEKMKRIATESRQDIENFLNKKIYLEVYIKVKKKWINDRSLLTNLGYE
ncbi:GTP-binding protein Era [Candidatus Kinetoplastibacterium desouzaii TCC079E]|uniref:GTPase Era n=1 Tax=Candidatus Kinetoplastidibacterium desouzai TCC079E TaxID=1208919 RepID=M1LUL6_9PROT|nr:GTPase Era [Candidatus Kinetoplastibacterium desouzaii]AGF47004.1 GTP-binding protein Era [Candidatus Kinetoplastibacterium desouzaii TCC079E]